MPSIDRFLLTSQSQIGCNTDCACTDRPFDVVPNIIASDPAASGTEPYTQAPDVFTCSLPGGHYVALAPFAPYGPSVFNRAGWARWLEYTEPRPLADDYDRQLAGERLVWPLLSQPIRAPIPLDSSGGSPLHASAYSLALNSAHTLTVWLHVTNACNLACPYCYVRKSSASLPLAAGETAIRTACAAAAHNGMRSLKLKYAGGEASLRFSLIRSLHAAALAAAGEYGLILHEVLLTNGTLLRPADADWCYAAGIKIMISLDGVGAAHDQLRPLPTGGGSFERVQRTVDEVLLPRGLRPDISMTVTGVNAHAAAAVARWALLDRGLPLSFNLYRANPLSATRTELALEEDEIIAGLLAAYAEIEAHLPTEPFLAGLADRGHMHAHSHTCGVGSSYLVIDHNGCVSQCQMHLDHAAPLPAADDLLPLIRRGPIHSLPVDAKEGCRACTFRYRCTGGCPLETLRATGRWDVQSPNCRIYQALWPAAIRLEGLRLLKAHGLLH